MGLSRRVHRAKLFGRGEKKIAPFERRLAQLMRREPYHSAHRLFWIVDTGSSHRGTPAIARLKAKWPNLVLVHTPVQASWLNQVETYFSSIQRKVLTPNDFPNLAALKDHLLRCQQRYEASANPFRWTFTRRDLQTLLAKFDHASHPLAA